MAKLAYGPGDKIYDDAIQTRNVLFDKVLGDTLTGMNYRTKQDKFGNQSLVPINVNPGQAIWKSADAIQLVNAFTVAKLKPIEDNSVSQQQGFTQLINTLQP